jgi:hypothetical protein
VQSLQHALAGLVGAGSQAPAPGASRV